MHTAHNAPLRHATQAGPYTLRIATTPGGINMTNAPPLLLNVTPAAASPANSNLTVTPGPGGTAVGGNATLRVVLADAFGNPRPNMDGVRVTVNGTATGAGPLSFSRFNVSAPGVFTTTFPFDALESVTFSLAVGNTSVGAAARFNASSVLPSALDLTASVANATLYVDASDPSAPRPPIAAAGVVPSEAWHTAHVPVVRALVLGWAGPFVADPGLNATLRVTPVFPNGTRDLRGARTFGGFWSWSGGDYAVPFKLPHPDTTLINASFVVMLTLSHPAGPAVRGELRRLACPMRPGHGLRCVRDGRAASARDAARRLGTENSAAPGARARHSLTAPYARPHATTLPPLRRRPVSSR